MALAQRTALALLCLAAWSRADDAPRVVVDPALRPREDARVVVASLAQALEWVGAQSERSGRFEIALVPGVHELRAGVHLGPELPALRLYGLGPDVQLVGGLVLAEPQWREVSDPEILRRLPAGAREQTRVLTLDPESLAGWSGGLAGPVQRGMGVGVSAVRSELFVAGRALTPARWPNEGFAEVDGVSDPGSVPRKAGSDIPESERISEPDRGGTFELADLERLARWAAAEDLWAVGYWYWDWADEQLRVARIDTESGSVTLARPHRYGLRGSARFYVTNLLEELDAPGEYWIDDEAGEVYAWLPEGQASSEVTLSLLAEPLLTLDHCREVTLEGLSFERSRGGAIVAEGVERVEILRCSFQSLGARAVRLDGVESVISECLFTDIGGEGVSLSGGQRSSLTHADNRVEDCVFRGCGRLMRTYNPAIRLAGVGQTVTHNEISELPHFAITFGGNEHTIEANHIHHVVQETGDAGAIYCGRDWTVHGTVIRENFFHDIQGSDARYQNAVYLDDMASGITVERNLFVRCNWGMLVGGGRDNTLRDNVFLACGQAIHYDARGVGWMAKNIADPATSTLHRRLAAVPIESEPWSTRYPSLRSYLSDRFGRPVGGRVEGNLLFDTPLGKISDRECVLVQGNVELPIPADAAARLARELTAGPLESSAVFPPPQLVADFTPIACGAAGPRPATVGAPTELGDEQPAASEAAKPGLLGGTTLPIAVWLQAPANATRYRELGINLYLGLWKGPTAEQVAELRRHSMPVVCAQNEWAREHLDEPLIVGWMHTDEPDNARSFADYWGADAHRVAEAWPEYQGHEWLTWGPPVAPATLAGDYARMKASDPSRPVLINLGQGVAWTGWGGRGVRSGHLEDYPRYLEACDIASFDIYPVVHKSPQVAGNLEYVARGVERLVQWTGGEKPVWACIECTHIDNAEALATPAEIRAEVWMALIHGARGLVYFAHEFAPRFQEAALLADAPTARAVGEINAQVQELAAVLASPPVEGLVEVSATPEDSIVDITVRRFEGATYVFAVAMRPQAATVTFRFGSAPDSARVAVLGEQRRLELRQGSFEDSFAPYEVHLYRID